MRKNDRMPMSEAERARRLHSCYELLLSIGREKGILQTADSVQPGRDAALSAAVDTDLRQADARESVP